MISRIGVADIRRPGRARRAVAVRAVAVRAVAVLALGFVGLALWACGGSSSETPYPLEPLPHRGYGGAAH